MKPVVLGPGEGETISDRAERNVRILFDHELVDITWTRYEPGERGPDPHIHRQHADAWYILEGELVFGLGSDGRELRRVPAGGFVLVPAGVIHTFRNEGPATARFLNFHAPSMGFAESLRASRDGREFHWDSFDPPEDGGQSVSKALIRLPGEGEQSEQDGRVQWIKTDFPELSVLEFEVDPGWTVPPHHHDDHVDSFYVLDGDVEFLTADGALPAASGSLRAAPPGVVHGIRNTATGRSRLLNVHAPDAGFVARNR
jgi:quercetin dioxygenase-like cupin family protein